MNLLTTRENRKQGDESWDWMLEIRRTLLVRIQAITDECDDPRELTDLAALLARINKKIQVRGLD